MNSTCTSFVEKMCNDTLVMILAGGQGRRLYDLTKTRAKPSIEFASSYRLIDFPLSNCINSGLKKIGVVTQYKARTLLHHLAGLNSLFNNTAGEFLELIPASQQISGDWYQGTADALYQNIDFIQSINPKQVLILSGDHVYKMDYRNLLKSHLSSQASMTISCIDVPESEAYGNFGVVNCGANLRVSSFQEKPAPSDCPINTCGLVFASMGNYVFDTAYLIETLRRDADSLQSNHDFAHDIIPAQIGIEKVQAFCFRDQDNNIPYWKDVGTLDNYWRANMDLLGSDPAFEVSTNHWPIWSAPRVGLPSLYTLPNGGFATIVDAMIGNACRLQKCQIDRCVLCDNVEIQNGTRVADSVVLANSVIGKNATIYRAVVDSACKIPDNAQIGVDKNQDRHNGFKVTKDGVTLITQTAIDRLYELKKRTREALTTQCNAIDESMLCCSQLKANQDNSH